MRSTVCLRIYGHKLLLATLTKSDVIPIGVFAGRKSCPLVRISRNHQARLSFSVESVALSGAETLVVSNDGIQVSDLLPGSQLEEFDSFIVEAQENGWTAERYIDKQNEYYREQGKHNCLLNFYEKSVFKPIAAMVKAAIPACSQSFIAILLVITSIAYILMIE